MSYHMHRADEGWLWMTMRLNSAVVRSHQFRESFRRTIKRIQAEAA